MLRRWTSTGTAAVVSTSTTDTGKPANPGGENDRSAQRRYFRKSQQAHDPSSPKAPPEPCCDGISVSGDVDAQGRKRQVMHVFGKVLPKCTA